MKFTKSFVICSIGFFALAAQTLLFRQFLVSFEGNELGIGAFFGSWFVWIGIGALLVSRAGSWIRPFTEQVELISLLYLPAFFVQHILIAHARQIMGIDPYEFFGFGSMITTSLIVNAPVSLMTGILFPLACQWVEQSGNLPVSKVYFWESAGGCLGGMAVTIALWQEIPWPIIFFLSAFLLSLSVSSVRRVKGKLWLPVFILSGLLVAAVPIGMAKRWNEYDAHRKWQRLIPQATFQGVFQTPQGEYIYGTYQEDQFLITSCGQVSETYPDRESAGRIAALHLAENPQARKVLMLGANIVGISQQFLQINQIENIAIYHPDPDYALRLRKLLIDKVPELRSPKLEFISEDIRSYLNRTHDQFDITILNLPDATAAVLNRFFSLEFYQAIQTAMTENGVMGVRISGGENVIGTELTDLGASVWTTLHKVFPQVVVEPGEETWLVAGKKEQLTENPKELVKRFQGIEGSDRIFPAEALETLFPENRVSFARRVYESSDLPSELLINTDERPLAHLYSLLLLGRHTHSPFTRLIKQVSLAGIWFFLLPIVVLVVVRVVYVWRSRRFPGIINSTFSSLFLVFSTGLISIGSEIVLMYQFQTRYGSLYLYVGLIGSLFMLGLAVGAAVSRWLLLIPKLTWRKIALGTVTIHCVALLSLTHIGSYWNYPLFILAFIICGLLTGMYFPLAACALELANVKARQSGGRLEHIDHIGAALGGYLTGILLLPILGSKESFLILVVLLGVNLVFISFSARTQSSASVCQHPAPILRKVGYICFALAACIVLNSNLLARMQTQPFPYNQAAALAYGENIEPKSKMLAEDQKSFVYYEITDQHSRTAQPSAYIYPTPQLAVGIKGYGGPIHLAVRIDPNGVLEEYRITHSNETPSYLEILSDWPKSLQSKNLFVADSLDDIAAVTGATMTCDAIKKILQQSGQRFGQEILGQDIPTSQTMAQKLIHFNMDRQSLVLLVAFCLAFLVSRVGERWSRRVFLLLCLAICGWWFNLQYSIEQVVTLLSGQLPQVQLTHNFLLVIGIPITVMAFGNLYCGYICPFGALQELVDFIIPKQIKNRLNPNRSLMRWSRFGKYLVLFILICSYFCIRQRQVLSTDILIDFFSHIWKNYKWHILIPTFAGTLLFTRFWCRYVCPAGAFLALLGRWAPLKRLLPAKIYSRCDLGVNNASELDCISCDRCRYESAVLPITKAERSEKPHPKAFTLLLPIVTLILVLTIFSVTAISLTPYIQTDSFQAPGWMDSTVSVPGAAPSTGEPRKVDEEKIRRMIQQKQLSEHEAEFYRKIPTKEE